MVDFGVDYNDHLSGVCASVCATIRIYEYSIICVAFYCFEDEKSGFRMCSYCLFPSRFVFFVHLCTGRPFFLLKSLNSLKLCYSVRSKPVIASRTISANGYRFSCISLLFLEIFFPVPFRFSLLNRFDTCGSYIIIINNKVSNYANHINGLLKVANKHIYVCLQTVRFCILCQFSHL